MQNGFHRLRRIRSRWWIVAFGGALFLAFLPQCKRVRALVDRTPSQRLEPSHLAATHAAVVEIRKRRQSLPSLRDGFQDFRCIFHAHAEDSVHTGGTRPEMLADAIKAGVHAVFLSDHFRPPRDFMNSWRGLRDGVLFIPGSEVRGFLVHPTNSVMDRMDTPVTDFVNAISAGDGLLFLSHIEERPDHSMENLSGLEIYNRHYDAKRDIAGLISIAMKLTAPESLATFSRLVQEFPDEILACQVRRQEAYLDKWDQETAQGRRLTGIAANDCHHNQVLIVKMVDTNTVAVGTIVDKDENLRKVTATLRPGIRTLTQGHQPGDILARVDLDPYYRSFRNVSTHVLASDLTEPALRAALRAGRAYVAHEWICDATGFRFDVAEGASMTLRTTAHMGDELPLAPGLHLRIETPVSCKIRLLRNGQEVAHVEGREWIHRLNEPGVYRCETAFVIHGELREWIYSNPIYVR